MNFNWLKRVSVVVVVAVVVMLTCALIMASHSCHQCRVPSGRSVVCEKRPSPAFSPVRPCQTFRLLIWMKWLTEQSNYNSPNAANAGCAKGEVRGTVTDDVYMTSTCHWRSIIAYGPYRFPQ